MNPLPQAVTGTAIEADERLELNSGDVAAKEIDGEILVMNVANGMYYSLEGVSAVAWRLLAAGHSLRNASAALAASFGVDEATTLDDVMSLALRLVDEGLVTVSEAPAAAQTPAIPVAEEGMPYSAPRLTAYSDMADLLALDPPMPGLAETSWIAPDEA